MWLGRLAKNKDKPLGFKWVSCPTRFLGVHLSYDKKGNDYQNFDLWDAISFKSGMSSRLVIEKTIAMVEIVGW